MIVFQKSSSISDPDLPWSAWAACAPRNKAVKVRNSSKDPTTKNREFKIEIEFVAGFF